MKTTLLLTTLAAALAVTAGAVPAEAARPTPEAVQASADPGTAPDLSLTIDWRAGDQDSRYMTGPGDRVDFAAADPTLSTWYAGWGRNNQVGVYARHDAQYPWNAPTTFDVPYYDYQDQPDGSTTTLAGTLHVTVTHLPQPSTPRDETTMTSNADVAAMWDGGDLITGDTSDTEPFIDMRTDASPSTKTLLPLNATMATYFKATYYAEHLTLSRKPGAPTLPILYWTKPWFAVDYIAHVEQCDPTRACRENPTVLEDQSGQLRFTKPAAKLVAYPGPLRIGRPNATATVGARSLVKKAYGLQLGSAQFVIDSVDARSRRFYTVSVDRDAVGTSLYWNINLDRKPGQTGAEPVTTLRYHLTGLDRAGDVVSSKQVVMTIRRV